MDTIMTIKKTAKSNSSKDIQNIVATLNKRNYKVEQSGQVKDVKQMI